MFSEFNSTAKINVQLINKDYLIHSWCNWDNVYSIDEFKMGILAANAYNPGFCPFILNLIRSSGKVMSAKQSGLWLVEYAHGLEHEIYCVPIHHRYQIQFTSLVQICFNTGILLIGIRRRKPKCPFELYDIFINPTNLLIEPGDEALVLATDHAHAKDLDGRMAGQGAAMDAGSPAGKGGIS